MIILQTVGLLGRVIGSSQGLYLNTGQHKHRINTYTYQTSMSCVGFEPTIPDSERAKTVHALDLSATVTGHIALYGKKIIVLENISKERVLINF
jgi:FAD synthase